MRTLKVDIFPQMAKMQERMGRPLTSKRIAEVTGIHESTISAYKTGKVGMVKLENLQRLAEFFGCSAGDLLSAEGAVTNGNR